MQRIFHKIKKPLAIILFAFFLFSRTSFAFAQAGPLENTTLPKPLGVDDVCGLFKGGVWQTAKDIAQTVGTGGLNIQLCYGPYLLTYALLVFVSSLVGPAGALLDWAVTPNPEQNITAINAIKDGWSIFKSLANIFLIFYLLFSVVPIVFRVGKEGAGQRIFNIILVAILINFSFLITAFVIDTGQLLGTFFWKGMVPTAAQPGALAHISTGYMAASNILSVLDIKDIADKLSWFQLMGRM